MSEAPSTAPVCYRHPSRETLISCSRCSRPICTSCMNDAAVGHQCPDCVRQGRRSQRPARTAFGGSRAGRGGYVTKAVVLVNFLFLIASAVTGGPRALAGGGGWFGLLGTSTPVTEWGAVVGRVAYGGALHGVSEGEWHRLVTAMFLHYGAVHLVLNMSLLLTVGAHLEEKLGPMRFAALYLLAGFGGNVAAYVLQPPWQFSAGASTATFGLVMAMIVVNRRLTADNSTMIPLLATNLIFTFGVPGISIAGHLGGLVVGGAASAVLAYSRLPHRTAKQVGGLTLILLLLIAAALSAG